MFKYNLFMTSQQMTIMAMSKQMSHGYKQSAAQILSTGFIGQFKEWWEEHLVIKDRNIIHNIFVWINNDESDIQDRNILLEIMEFNTISILDEFTSDDNPEIAQEHSSKLFPSSNRYQHIFLGRSDRDEIHNRNFFKGLLISQYKKIKS